MRVHFGTTGGSRQGSRLRSWQRSRHGTAALSAQSALEECIVLYCNAPRRAPRKLWQWRRARYIRRFCKLARQSLDTFVNFASSVAHRSIHSSILQALSLTARYIRQFCKLHGLALDTFADFASSVAHRSVHSSLLQASWLNARYSRRFCKLRRPSLDTFVDFGGFVWTPRMGVRVLDSAGMAQ